MQAQEGSSDAASRVTRREKTSRFFLPSRVLKRQTSSEEPDSRTHMKPVPPTTITTSTSTCNTATQSPPTTSPEIATASFFLSIPSEIRREIFRYLLPNDKKRFHLYTDCDSGTAWNRQNSASDEHFSLAILRTNRLIYQEALSVIYSENLFHFIVFNYLPVLDFIRRLSPDSRRLVRKVRLTLLTEEQGQQPPKHDVFCTTIHDYLPGLTTLHADPWIWF